MTAPCDRTEKVWINPNSGPSNCCTAGGAYTICTPPSGLTLIDDHQLEYRQVNSVYGNLGWEEQTSTIYYGYCFNTSLTQATIPPSSGISYLTLMIPSSGPWLVRYRNIKGSTCPLIGNLYTPGTNLWAGNWVVEYWPL
jgi:hypothetical protein